MLGAVVLGAVTHSDICINIVKPRPWPRTPKAYGVAPPLTVSAGPVIGPTLVGPSAFTVAELRFSSVIML